MTAFSQGRAKTGGRKSGSRNKRTIAAAARPDALLHLEKVMTSTDGTITPDLKLRAAIALAQYQHSKPIPSKLVDPIPYTAPKTVDEARALILELGERFAKGEIGAEAHDVLVGGLKAYLGDRAAEQEKIFARLEASLRGGEELVSFESRALRLEREHGHAGADDIVVTVAADFLHGGEPTFARAFDRRGSLIFAKQRLEGEPWATFKTRARVEAGKAAGACSMLIGGLPGEGEGESKVGMFADFNELPRGVIVLPEAALHPSQI